jgi:hypothetical protein
LMKFTTSQKRKYRPALMKNVKREKVWRVLNNSIFKNVCDSKSKKVKKIIQIKDTYTTYLVVVLS